MGKSIIINTLSFANNNLGQVNFIDEFNYFTITANEDLIISFTNDIEYRIKSIYWKTLEANTELELLENQQIKIKCNILPTKENGIGTFSISGEFSVSGNLITLTNNNLYNYGFKNLFKDCSTLVNIDNLIFPDYVSIGCYEGMFKNCTSLEVSSILPSESLITDCYKEMFYGCTLLNKIIVYSIDSLSSLYSENWVYGVSENGLIEISAGVIHDIGVNGIPEELEAKKPFDKLYFTIESLEDNNTISLNKCNSSVNPIIYYSLDNGETWNDKNVSASSNTFATINTGETIIFKSNNNTLSTAWDHYHYFIGSKQFKVYGNIMSLLNGDDFKSNSEFTSGTTHNLCGLFKDSTNLIDASNLILPSLIGMTSSYNGMFRGCTNLQHGPQMLTITPAKELCSSMFEACINLEEAIEINFTTLADQCCFRMFCMNRDSKITTPKMTKSPILRVENGVSNCYKEMFKGNGNLTEITCLLNTTTSCTDNWTLNISSTGTFYKNPSATWNQGNTSNVPVGWTIVDYIEE